LKDCIQQGSIKRLTNLIANLHMIATVDNTSVEDVEDDDKVEEVATY